MPDGLLLLKTVITFFKDQTLVTLSQLLKSCSRGSGVRYKQSTASYSADSTQFESPSHAPPFLASIFL